jgi:hypothetical protein
MNARWQSFTSATVAKLVDAFLWSKDAMAWRATTRQEFERILRVEVVLAWAHRPTAGQDRTRLAIRRRIVIARAESSQTSVNT